MSLMIFIVSFFSIDSLLNQPALNNAQYGIYVLNLSNDSVIYARNSQRLFIPASNMKLITSAAALFYLGPDYRFKTKLAIKGKIKNKKLSGDLIIIGQGDPGLTFEDLERFIQAIKNVGIREIKGDIVLDDRYFTELSLNGNNFRYERLPVGWAWHYLDAHYAPEVSALSLNKNCVNVIMEATTPGEKAEVFIEPEIQYVTLQNNMITKQGEDSIIILRKPGSKIIYLGGGIGFGHKKEIEVSVPEPAMFFGTYFKERLLDAGIKFKGKLLRPDQLNYTYRDNQARFKIIDSIISPPLFELLHELNTESINLYAEILLKTLGARYTGEGSFLQGINIIKHFLAGCGIDTSRCSIWDGSGLSRHNLVSPYQIALVLRYLYLSRYAARFFELLPTIGEGTLEKRFSDFDGVLRGKTGSLHAVSCLSGYLNIYGTDYCFSMLFNNFTCSRKVVERIQEQIILALQQAIARKDGKVLRKG